MLIYSVGLPVPGPKKGLSPATQVPSQTPSSGGRFTSHPSPRLLSHQTYRLSCYTPHPLLCRPSFYKSSNASSTQHWGRSWNGLWGRLNGSHTSSARLHRKAVFPLPRRCPQITFPLGTCSPYLPREAAGGTASILQGVRGLYLSRY